MHESGSRRGYHHGNLREALVDAAVELIAEHGPAGFTVAEAARLAGVSPGAPYRHFRDSAALLAEVARRGFERFGVALTAAWDGAGNDPVGGFEALGRAYLGFARTEPAYFAAMFDQRLDAAEFPETRAAGDAAFAVFRAAAEAMCAKLPAARRPPALMVALHVWALAHGIAALFGRKEEARRRLPMPPEALLEAGVLIYLQSLGLAGGAAPRDFA